MIKEVYVSFATAVLLNNKGFDGEAHCGYDAMTIEKPYPHKTIPKPTQQVAMKWLREVHKLHIELNWNYANQQYSFQIWKIGKSQPELYSLDLWHDNHEYAGEWNYEQACEAAIKYCLINLI